MLDTAEVLPIAHSSRDFQWLSTKLATIHEGQGKFGIDESEETILVDS